MDNIFKVVFELDIIFKFKFITGSNNLFLIFI
jgi:hypothetical protein